MLILSRLRAVALAGVLLAAYGPARAASDPDWPCQQPLVGALSAGTYWAAAPAPAGQAVDPELSGIIAATAPRTVPVDEALTALGRFADSVPPPERGVRLALLFQGLVDETNAERDRVIGRIKDLARRQRELSQVITGLGSEIRAQKTDSPEAAEVAQRRDFATRAYQEAQRTMRYACEVPPALDARLGRFARLLQERLGG